MFNRERAISFLLRRPEALNSRIARALVLALTVTGAAFLVWSAVIHLELWGQGYSDISVIGPLFLVQGIACIVIALAIVALRWLVLLVVGLGAGVLTAVGLLITVYYGLFGFRESLAVPYATLSLAVEFATGFIFLVAAVLLAVAPLAQGKRGGFRGHPGGNHRAAARPARLRLGGNSDKAQGS